MPFLTNDPLPQCLQPSPLTPLLLDQGHRRGSRRYLSNVKDTAGEITARRQSQAILCIMVELVRAEVLFSSSLAPRCEQIFPREFGSGEFASSIGAYFDT